MRKIFFSLLIAPVFFVGKASGQVDDIINKHLQAIGGVELIKTISAIKFEGTLSTQGFDIPYVKTRVNGKGVKQTITVMGSDGFILATTDSGWNYIPALGHTEPVPMAAPEFKEWGDEMDAVDNFADYKANGSTVIAVAKDTVNGKPCPGLQMTFKNGYVKTFYFDPSTWYIVRTVGLKTMNSGESEVKSDLSSFEKTPEGIVLPKQISSDIISFSIGKITVNPKVDPGLLIPKIN